MSGSDEQGSSCVKVIAACRGYERSLRTEYEGAWCHAMNRGRGGQVIFPDDVFRQAFCCGRVPRWQLAVMLAAARLRHVAGSKWGTRRYLDMRHLQEMDLQATTA